MQVLDAICYVWLMSTVGLIMNEAFCQRGIHVFGW